MKIKTCPCGISFEPTNNRQVYCSPEHAQRVRDARRGKSVFLNVERIAPYSHRGGTRTYIDRRPHRPFRKNEPGELFCEDCGLRLGLVVNRVFHGKHRVVDRRGVLCQSCLCNGIISLNKITHALPVIGTAPAPTAPTPSYSRRLEWTFVYDDGGQIIAATCEESELAEAA